MRTTCVLGVLVAGASVLALAGCAAQAGEPGAERASAVRSPLATCAGAGAVDFDCHARRYRAVVAAAGPRAAIRDLSGRAGRPGYLGAACHQLMHGIGRAAGRRDGIGAFGQGDDSCSSGFFHGVVEAVMARLGKGRLRDDPEQVCARFRARAPGGMEHYNCAHGMGHGFMEVHASDVFAALKGCAGLRRLWEREHCEGGVFMENLTALSHPRRPSRHLRPDRPLYPCTAVPARLKHECYMKQTAYALYVHDHDFEAVFALCAASPDVAFRPDCHQGLGGDAAIRASKYVTGVRAQQRTIRALCRRAPSAAAERDCLVGAVTVIVRDGATASADPSALCASLRTGRLRMACSRAHLRTVGELAADPQARRHTASLGGRGPRALCLRADRLETTAVRTLDDPIDRRNQG